MNGLESKEWWRDFLKRINFPMRGRFGIVPGDTADEVLLMNLNTMSRVHVRLTEHETLEDCAEFFQSVIPNGIVKAPACETPTHRRRKQEGDPA